MQAKWQLVCRKSKGNDGIRPTTAKGSLTGKKSYIKSFTLYLLQNSFLQQLVLCYCSNEISVYGDDFDFCCGNWCFVRGWYKKHVSYDFIIQKIFILISHSDKISLQYHLCFFLIFRHLWNNVLTNTMCFQILVENTMTASKRYSNF